jgi:hypothetical protein
MLNFHPVDVQVSEHHSLPDVRRSVQFAFAVFSLLSRTGVP